MFKTWDTDSLEQQIMESYTLHHYSGMPPPSAWSGAVPPRSIERPGTLWCLQVTWQAWQGGLPEAPQLCARSKQLFLDVDGPRKDSSPASTLNHRLLRSKNRALRLHLSQVSGPIQFQHAFKRKEENNHWRSLNFILTALNILNATYKWSIMSICTPGHQHCGQHQRCTTWSCNIHGHIRKKSQESKVCRAKNLSFDGFLADFGWFWLILAAVTTVRWPLGCLVWWKWAWQLMAL